MLITGWATFLQATLRHESGYDTFSKLVLLGVGIDSDAIIMRFRVSDSFNGLLSESVRRREVCRYVPH